eukprot:m.231910 g.231910  ORF g.231910 m.231910 type:complete len:423 (-) comp13900_c1_seq5:2722-3990(-)
MTDNAGSNNGKVEREASSCVGRNFEAVMEHRIVAFVSKKMSEHDPPSGLKGMSELKERGDVILKELEAHKEDLHLDIFEPDDQGDGCILNVHDENLYMFVKIAFDRYKKQQQRAGDSEDSKQHEEEVTYFQNDSFAVGSLRSDIALMHVIEVLEDDSLDILHAAGLFLSDSATFLTKGTFEAAYDAAQCAVSAVRSLFFPKKKLRRKLSSLVHTSPNKDKRGAVPPVVTYALCRPPGHHASTSVAGGFCFFNNVAIAAQFAVDMGYRVSILDVDFHHGNGTQSIFYNRKDVLFVSMHCDPRNEFPFWSGYEEETGIGEGVGHTLNIPLPIGTNGEEFLYSLRTAALPKLAEKKMDILLVSFGADTARGDPEGSFLLDTADFEGMGEAIRTHFPNLRIAVIQEGGYGLDVLGKNVVAFLKGIR